ncbi:hypothetical protein IVB12_15805 [Bradyrhizobium sp. 179]|uniref:hypothetical protein n=1 Tax=Bradyrhizobium sp. 179 TaxID=2782648 RepID=UPI001FF86601|nr:hypothetical protein [Bradyrhizobium sp. 179]MCK1543381.1 hypothetical protein [Bradyrhizobium sp. 179]
MSLELLQRAFEATRPRRIDPRELHTVVTLAEMRQAFVEYVRLRKIQFCGPNAHKKPVKEYFERKIAYIEGRFPAFRAAYKREFER